MNMPARTSETNRSVWKWWAPLCQLAIALIAGCQVPSSDGLEPAISNWGSSYPPTIQAECQHCASPRYSVQPNTVPCGEEGYRPRDEYVCDGGDRVPRVRSTNEVEISDLEQHGWNLEDTVAQYETRSGKRETVASSRTCVYAPRFAAVRRVTGLTETEVHETLQLSRDRLTLVGQQRNIPSNAVAQPISTVRNVRNLMAQSIEDGNRGKMVDDIDQVRTTRRKILPFENLQVIQTGLYHSGEKLRLATALLAAETWTEKAAVQVTVNGVAVGLAKRTRGPMEAYEYELREGVAKLRVVKVASVDDAKPGEEVHFTIRFDNMGEETLDQIVLVDNLTTRLEYVDESQECSLDATFKATENNGQSLMLRWELQQPLPPHEGGVIRFTCRVR